MKLKRWSDPVELASKQFYCVLLWTMRDAVSLGPGARMAQSVVPPTSRHIERTDPSPIYKVLANVASSKQDVLSLAQGSP